MSRRTQPLAYPFVSQVNALTTLWLQNFTENLIYYRGHDIWFGLKQDEADASNWVWTDGTTPGPLDPTLVLAPLLLSSASKKKHNFGLSVYGTATGHCCDYRRVISYAERMVLSGTGRVRHDLKRRVTQVKASVRAAHTAGTARSGKTTTAPGPNPSCAGDASVSDDCTWFKPFMCRRRFG